MKKENKKELTWEEKKRNWLKKNQIQALKDDIKICEDALNGVSSIKYYERRICYINAIKGLTKDRKIVPYRNKDGYAIINCKDCAWNKFFKGKEEASGYCDPETEKIYAENVLLYIGDCSDKENKESLLKYINMHKEVLKELEK